MTSQAYNNIDVLLFLPQIWKIGMKFDVLVTVFPLPLFWYRGVLLNSEFRRQQYWGDKKNNIHEEGNWKYFHSS